MSAIGSVPAGTRVGRYEIVSLLRQGGMGEVYTAEDRNLGRRVALKILPRNRTSDPDRVARFVREARASSTLNHPSIVSIHDAGSEGDVHFLAMELIDGRPLSEWMRKRQALAARVDVMAQVADGLAQAHDAGIVHRDLKPDNIMITSEGRAKIVDFGVAKLTERVGERSALSGITTPTSRVGTTAYMSPEQVEGKKLDRRTDVFSFGVVLYELLTGTNPFAVAQYADTLHNVVHLEPSMERIPRQLQKIVRRCLSKEPERRYDSMRDTALDLREAVADVAPPRRRRRLLIAALGLAIVAVAVMATWIVLSRGEAGGVPRGMTMTRLTNSGRVTTAAISPDGKYLVHAVEEGDQQALYVKQIATGTMTRIADAAPRYYSNLQVSADGNYAYYVAAERDDPNIAHVFQLPLLGGTPRRIAEDTEFWYSVSPDGKRVVFRRFNAFVREHRLTVADIDGGGEEILLRRKPPFYLEQPVWTPDGKAITFVSGNSSRKGSGALYRMTLSSRTTDRIPTPKFPGVGSYAWLPDGSGGLVTAFDTEQPPQIWFVPSGDTVGRKVTSEVSAYYSVTPTADSQTFSAVREVTDANIHTVTLEEGRNGSSRALTSGFGNWVGGGGVRWLSEKEVLFSAIADGMNTFFVVDASGKGTPRRLIHNMTMWNIAVAPDGSRIAFVSNKSGSSQIWVADASGANARQVTKGSSFGWPSFTPDSQSLVYLSVDQTQYAWRVPIDGSTAPVKLTSLPTSRVLMSPDGKLLLCRMRMKDPKGGPLWRTTVVAADGSGTARTFDAPRYGGGPILQWHPNGRAFVFVDFKDGIDNLWMQDLAGGEPRQLTFFESGDIFRFDLAPDGKRLALVRGDSTRDAVLIRDFR